MVQKIDHVQKSILMIYGRAKRLYVNGNQLQVGPELRKEMGHGNHFCQRCKLPLAIDNSLATLSKAQSHLLTSGRLGYGRDKADTVELGDKPFISQEKLDLLHAASSNNKEADWGSNEAASESFVILPKFDNDDDDDIDSRYDELDNKTLSNRLKSLSTIFNILSSKSDIDYPVCKDCAQLLLNGMKSQYEKTAKERDTYLQFLQKLENRQAPLIPKSEESIKEIDRLKKQEAELLQELQDLESEKDELDDEILNVQKELEEIELEEQELLKTQNAKELEEQDFRAERDAIKAEYDFNLRQLEKLRKSNVYNDTFNISHDGPFGTINGLRLGSIEGIKVPWQEINAALGQVVLLLATISNRLNIKSANYRLRPMGSTSRIEKIERDLAKPNKPKVTVLEVFSSGEYQIERLFNHSKLDNAMIAILDILTEISQKIKEFDSTIELPYKMSRDRIGDASIRLSTKTADEEWTSACKFLLTNLKWILAYSSAHAPSR